MYMSAIDPKGLTAAVLATQAVAYIPDMEVGLFIRNVVFSVILFSIVLNSILIPLISHERLIYRIYMKVMLLNTRVKDAMSKSTKEQNEKWKKRSKAREIADEMFYPEVINNVLKEQDTPGALSTHESNNYDVAD